MKLDYVLSWMIFSLSINKKYTLYIPRISLWLAFAMMSVHSVFTHELGQLPFFFFCKLRSRIFRLLLVLFGRVSGLFHCVL